MEINSVLLRKVEELTLYVIDQNERLEAQDSRLRDLERERATHGQEK